MKNLLKTALLILSVGMLSCSQEKKEPVTENVEQPAETKPAFSLDSVEYTVLAYDSTNRLFPPRSKPVMLTKVEVAEAERQLKDFVDAFNRQHWENEKAKIHLKAYKRQYLAATHNGQKLVYINALCHAPTPAGGDDSTVWKTHYLKTDYGGRCYFQVTLNLDQKNVMKFHINEEE